MKEYCLPFCPYRKKDTYCTENIRLFRSLPDEARKKLCTLAIHTQRERNEIVVHYGDPIDSILIITKGEVKTSVCDEEGREHVFDFLHAGLAIWHGLFLKDPRYTYDVTSVSNVSLCFIRRSDFMTVLHKNPDSAMYLIEMLSSELEEVNQKIVALSIKDPTARVARFLIFHDSRAHGQEIHMKLEDIANAISLRPETISRSIAVLARKKLIARTGQGRIRVIDSVGLAEISRDSKE